MDFRTHSRGLPGRAKLSPLWVTAFVLLVVIGLQVRHGFQGGVVEAATRRYWQRNSATFENAPFPSLDQVDATVEIDPAARSIAVRGSYVIRNPRTAPLHSIPLTPGLGWRDLTWTLDGQEIQRYERGTPPPAPYVEDRAGLWVFTLSRPLAKDETATIGFTYSAINPDGWTRNGGGVGQFMLPSGVVLTSFTPSFLPVVGFIEGVGVDEDNRRDSREYPDDHWRGLVDPAFGPAWSMQVRLEVTGPADWTLNAVGVPTEERVADGRRTVVWETDHPVRFFNIVGGPLEKAAVPTEDDGPTTAVFHAAEHPWNIAVMIEALAAARRHYSEWFHPYPWRDLKLTEFPGLADYAQGFPGNISFSESIGFLARPGEADDADAVFLITAHEAAHQWWGNILMPGRGPGGNVLSEGMAHFSAAMLFKECRGNEARKAFLKQIEESYVNGRVADAERPLSKIDGSRPGDGPTTYDKGGWVFWMTLEFMGREAALAGIREFFERFKDGPDFPLIEDFEAVMEEHAPDRAAFEAFARQWYFSVVLPEFRVERAVAVEQPDGSWHVEGEVSNIGTGAVAVTIGAELGDSAPGAEAEAPIDLQFHTTVAIEPGATVPFSIVTVEKPARVVVDPDVQVLQARRNQAVKTVD